MTKQEFEELVVEKVSDADYRIIEFVYTWHPAINDVGGKTQMAVLYEDFGMSVIRGMYQVASYMERIDKEEREVRKRLAEIEERKKALAVGDISKEMMLDR